MFLYKYFKYLVPINIQKSILVLVPFHCSFGDVEIESWEAGKNGIQVFFFLFFSLRMVSESIFVLRILSEYLHFSPSASVHEINVYRK